MDLSRREFTIAGLASLAALSGSASAQEIQTDADGFQDVAFLVGPASARPAPGSTFFDDKIYYAYIYEDENGSKSYLTQDMAAWQPLNYINQVNVFASDDLPDPTNGTHTLEGQTVYMFNGFVDSPYGLDISNGPALIGRHGSVDGFIHTGQATAITGSNGGFFARNLYFHAHGGTMFGISGDQSTEMLVQSCSFSDAAGLGQIASLGSITGYRVPTFKGCNFEEFASGLTFDGSPNKIFVQGSPIRNITASGVTMFTGAPTLDVDIIDVVNNYIKEVQTDTGVWYIDPSASINEVFQYRGNTHDATVTDTNILNGQIGLREVGTIVAESLPLRNTDVSGTLSLDSPYTITAGGPAIVAGPTTLENAERLSNPSNGVIQYDGLRDNQTRVTANMSISAANTRVAARILRNGTTISRTETTIDTQGTGSRDNLTVIAGSLLLETGDQVSVELEDLDGTADIEVGRFDLSV